MESGDQVETVEISKEEHERLLKSEAKLDALEAYGVDNWSGYDGAMHYMETGEIE